jgi:hypothetical protein
MKTCPLPIYGLIGLTAFGAAYDSGLFGQPDGFVHSAIVSIAGPTGPVAGPPAVVYVQNTVTGDDVALSGPRGPDQVTSSR